MSITEAFKIRTKILEVYPGWKAVNKMDDGQLVATYLRLKKSGKVK